MLLLLWPLYGIFNWSLIVFNRFVLKDHNFWYYEFKEPMMIYFFFPLLMIIFGPFSFFVLSHETPKEKMYLYKKTILNPIFLKTILYFSPILSLGLLWLI